jgi:AcrR family transcriptional regulator
MQVLKNAVRERILNAAKSEFLDRGYSSASMRSIADLAEITVGNIYRYFENKESLFENVVIGSYDNMISIVNDIKFEKFNTNNEELYNEFKETFAIGFSNFVRENYEEVVILTRKSKGTKFENAKENVTELIKKKLDSHINSSIKNNEINKDMLTNVMSVNIVNGIFEVVKSTDINKSEELERNMGMITDLYFKSISSRFDG